MRASTTAPRSIPPRCAPPAWPRAATSRSRCWATASSRRSSPSRPTASRSPRASASRPPAAPARSSRASRTGRPVLSTILNAFKVGDIRKKLAFTATMLALYRLGAYIPVPGVNTDALDQISQNYAGSNVLGLLNLFSGGGLSRIAIFALGIMPYITASIILQLLQVVVPSLEKLSKEGEVGQARITQYTRYLTVALAFAQSIGYVFLFRSFGNSAGTPVIEHFDVSHVFLIVISLTAGTILLMWMGELITQRGIGNGISLMIFASIVSGLPRGVQAWWTNDDQIFRVMMPFIALGVIAAIVFIQEGQRRIPIQYAKRVIGRRMTSGGQTYLPLRVNMAGVIPVIFAASLMAFPPT